MTAIEKKKQLESIIRELILPLIDKDYVLLDLPYHSNLGDTLIWQGELDLLKSLPYKCRYSTWLGSDIETIGRHILPDTIICFNGGGNFGDVWEGPNDFRKRIIERFPRNRVIIFPQTIFYKNEENLLKDAKFYVQYPNVTICARDTRSFLILQQYFSKNKSLLVPDMAFCMDINKYARNKNNEGTIFIKRCDIEWNDEIDYSEVPSNAYISDWTWLTESNAYKRQQDICKWERRLGKLFCKDLSGRGLDFYWHHYLRKLNVRTAIDVIDSYEHIYATRMHAALLALILGKQDITLYDNSYGKSSSLYDTWLSDVEGMKLERKC